MGIRQLVWALIAVLLLYGGWQILRSLTAGRRTIGSNPVEPTPVLAAEQPALPTAGADDGRDDDEGGFDYAPIPSADAAPAPRPPESLTAGPDLFAFELKLQRLRRELGAVRAALDVQQGEIGALHEMVQHLGEIAPARTAAAEAVEQSASPEYSEALVLARRGLSVEEISTRCGITRAEAELVVSLAARAAGEGGA